MKDTRKVAEAISEKLWFNSGAKDMKAEDVEKEIDTIEQVLKAESEWISVKELLALQRICGEVEGAIMAIISGAWEVPEELKSRLKKTLFPTL